jgi:hypothetical protein
VQEIADRPKGDSNTPPIDNNPRPSATLTGYVGGLIQRQNDHSNRHYRSARIDSFTGNAEIELDAANDRVAATFDGRTANGHSNRFMRTIHRVFQFGSTGSTGPANSAYADYDNFYANTPDNYVANGKKVTGVLVSANGVAANQVVANAIPNLTPCQCDYTRWGFWAIDSNSTNTRGPTSRETILGTWVAGRPVGSISDVPTTGTATYTGHVIANVNGTGFVAGGFSNAVDFGRRTGAVSVTNLDRTNYSGTVNFNNADPRNFGGTIQSTNVNVDGRNMTLQGSFFQGPNSPVGEMGGSVAISGANNYLGSGIFAATKR